MDKEMLIPAAGMVITRSVRLQPGEYDFREMEGIVIGADDLTIEAEGVTLRGGCAPRAEASDTNTEEFGYGSEAKADNGRALGFFGTGVLVENRKRVTIRGLSLRGFDQGVKLLHCEEITLEGCDLSDCFTDPAWGWDEHGHHGGILMIGTHRSRVAGCRANRVWDALNMRHSHFNTVEDNDFSHTSDTGLKLWNACDNRILRNNFSYGIRIDPGEVHARDSSSVLIESGSNRNYFFRNNMTHGGDGLFIRVLNGWMSTHNVFEENDCSHANNNAVEAWADHNTYIRNKANHSSYGFWLGNSDHTLLLENEAAYNGDEQHNAPESFGNCGIAIVNGSGSHGVLKGNYVHDNCGPGIAIRHEREMPSRHWIIEGNRIERNRDCGRYAGHGIYLQHAQWVTLGRNTFADNQGRDVACDGNVTDLVTLEGQGPELEAVRIQYAPLDVRAGVPVRFAVDGGADLRYRWDFGDGCTSSEREPEHIFPGPGLYAVGVTADNGAHAALDAVNLYVLPADFAPFEIEAACGEGLSIARESGIYGGEAWVATAAQGREHTLTLSAAQPLACKAGDALFMQLRYASDADTDWKRETRYPVVTVARDAEHFLRFTPTAPLLEMLYAQRNEERDNGRLFVLPLTGDALFSCERHGRGVEEGITSITLTYGGQSEAVSSLRINVIGVGAGPVTEPHRVDIAAGAVRVLAEGAPADADTGAPLRGDAAVAPGDGTPRVLFTEGGEYGVMLDAARIVDRVDVSFYQNTTRTAQARGERLPKSCRIEAHSERGWRAVAQASALRENAATPVRFDPVSADGIRAVFAPGEGPVAVSGFKVYHEAAMTGVALETEEREITVDRLEVKLNIERNGNGSPLGDLVARVFSLDAENKLADCLYAATIAKEAIQPYAITAIPTEGLRLREGGRYALALGQTNEAASRTEGDYYRWIAGRIEGNETFAIYSDGQTLPTDHDWGTAWLRVVSGQTTAAYVHHSQHVGTRFGIRGMQCRYQTFAAPRRTALLTDGRAAGEGCAMETDALRIRVPEGAKIREAHLYLDGPLPESLTLTAGDTVLGSIAKPETGRNVLPVSTQAAGPWLLTAQGGCLLSEVELIEE